MYLGADRGDMYAFAHAVVDAGADLVVGHGPHVPRGMEVYKDRLIAYSLGNFATYGAFNLKGVNGLGLVLEAKLAEHGTTLGDALARPGWSARFLRVHRNAIVNLDFVESMKADEQSQLQILMRDGTELLANREASKRLRDLAI